MAFFSGIVSLTPRQPPPILALLHKNPFITACTHLSLVYPLVLSRHVADLVASDADENVLLMEMITGERPNMNYLAATLNRSKSAIAAHSKILKEKADKAYIARQSKAEPSTAPVDPDEVIEAIKIFQPKPRAPRKPKDETAAKKKAGEGEAKAVAKRGRELNSDSGVPLTKRARGKPFPYDSHMSSYADHSYRHRAKNGHCSQNRSRRAL